ncbi:unnamed protein product [Cuscuta europaea]|uniref:Uncharacterized protein n=1 Tax=Cuscuta europaea TaxID=41803 RepID=A0A9P1E3X9_CUSEU|nr:unnamed protein product [Cuscuta europaea]
MNTSSTNLLEEALIGEDIVAGSTMRGRVVVIGDCVETNGGFLLHHFIKRSLSPNSSNVVVFLALAQPFSQYDRILRKMGCNLGAYRDSKRFIFLDMLMMEVPDRWRGNCRKWTTCYIWKTSESSGSFLYAGRLAKHNSYD